MQMMAQRWLYAAAALSGLAGFVHIIAAPEHFDAWLGYGMFFVIASACQFLYAVMLVAYQPPSREVLWTGILGNAAIIALWAATRFIGIPFFGPEAGRTEAIRFLDLFSVTVEVALIVCAARLLRWPKISTHS